MAHDDLLNRPGADDDADDDVDHTVGPPGLGISLSSVREAAWDDPTAVLAISEPSRRRRELWSPYAPETSNVANQKNLAAIDQNRGARLIVPWI